MPTLWPGDEEVTLQGLAACLDALPAVFRHLLTKYPNAIR